MFDYAGAVHFHSAHSVDARVPAPDILSAARKAGLDFAVLTDHFSLGARDEGLEKYHDKLLLIVGEEISPRYNHYLAFNIQKPIVFSKAQAQAQALIDAVQAQGGFGFIAHPDHAGAPLIGVRAYPWIDWNVTGFTGLGIWDLMGDWNRAVTSPWAALLACWRPERALRGPKPETLARWDALTQKGPCMAIGEVDNHGSRKTLFGFRWNLFPYEWAFRTIRTHVMLGQALTGEASADRAAVLEAIRLGHSYVSCDLWNDPKGFSFSIFDDGRRAGMGETFGRAGKPTRLEAKVPARSRVRVIRNGHTILEERKRPHVEMDVDLPGVYRLEADQLALGRWRPWIFSNPIWVL